MDAKAMAMDYEIAHELGVGLIAQGEGAVFEFG